MLKALREEYATLHKAAGDLLTACATAKREQTADEKTAQAARYSRMDAIRAQLDEHKKFAAMALDAGDVQTGDDRDENQVETFSDRDNAGAAGNAAGGALKGKKNNQASDAAAAVEQAGENLDARKFNRAVNHYLQTGQRDFKLFAAAGMSRELFALTTASGTGILVPTAVLNPQVIRRNTDPWRSLLAAFGLTALRREKTEGIKLPTFDDTANEGATQAQDATTNQTQDPTAAGLSMDANLYTSRSIWVANTLAMATDFDLFGYINPILDRRLMRTRNNAMTTYILANATTGKTTATNAAVTFAEFLDWQHSLPVSYRVDAGYVISDGLYRLLRGLVDSQNRPLIELDPKADWTTTLHGKPLFVDDFHAAPASNAYVGTYASAECVKILDAGARRIVRYERDPLHPDQVGFELFENGDHDFVTQGVKRLRMAA